MNHTLLGTPMPVGRQIQLALRHQKREIFQSMGQAETRLQQELQRVMASRPELHEVMWAFLLGVWAALLCVGMVLCIRVLSKRTKKKRIV